LFIEVAELAVLAYSSSYEFRIWNPVEDSFFFPVATLDHTPFGMPGVVCMLTSLQQYFTNVILDVAFGQQSSGGIAIEIEALWLQVSVSEFDNLWEDRLN
jgi:hypothetical protein